MKTVTPIPGYLVETSYWEQHGQNTTKSFTNTDLLTARQSAFQYAQTAVNQKLPIEVLDVAITLVEFEDEDIVPIAEVFRHRFHRSQQVSEEGAYTMNMEMDVGHEFEHLKSPVALTLDPTKTDEAFETPEAVIENIGQLCCEYEYYLSYGHFAGFGFVTLHVHGPHSDPPKNQDLKSLSDEQLQDWQVKFRKARELPFQSFFLLYDGLAYAASLISQYNQDYAESRGMFSFQLQFLA